MKTSFTVEPKALAKWLSTYRKKECERPLPVKRQTFLEGWLNLKAKLVNTENEMANSKKIKTIVICVIAAVVGIIALALIFGDFGLGQQMPHIWAKIVPGIFTIIGIAIIAYVLIESQNES